MVQQKLLIETKNKHVTVVSFSFFMYPSVISPSEPLPISASKKICIGPYVIDSLLESCVLFE